MLVETGRVCDPPHQINHARAALCFLDERGGDQLKVTGQPFLPEGPARQLRQARAHPQQRAAPMYRAANDRWTQQRRDGHVGRHRIALAATLDALIRESQLPIPREGGAQIGARA